MLGAVSVMLVVSLNPGDGRLIVNTEGSWTVQLWWILSGSILAAAAEARSI
jgi:hypothetical protein